MEEQRERLVERHVLKLSVDARTHVVILGRNASSRVRGNVGKNEESQHEQRTDNGHHSEEKLRIREKGRSNVGLVLEELHNETSNESSAAKLFVLVRESQTAQRPMYTPSAFHSMAAPTPTRRLAIICT